MNILFIAILLSVFILSVLIRKKKFIKDFSIKKEIKPSAKNIILSVILFVFSLNPIISGFPLKAYNFCLSLGFGGCGNDSSQIFWLNFFFDLMFWYIFSCFIIFIFKLNKQNSKQNIAQQPISGSRNLP